MMRHITAVVTADAYSVLTQHNAPLAAALLADIQEGATLADVQAFIDRTPILTRDEQTLILRAAAHLLAQQETEQP